MTERLKQIIARAIGPAPWYWETFPPLRGLSGEEFQWKHHGSAGELAYLVTLHRADGSHPLLALNTYCRPFPIGGHRLGIWCPEGRTLRFVCLDPDGLKPFDFTEIVGWFKNSSERIYSATAPLAEFEVSSQLPEGTHRIEVPPEFRDIEELLVVTNAPLSDAPDAPRCNINVLYPHAGLVEVLPQAWFTTAAFDLGYQWIARMARDPISHHILGDGVRMEAFELTDDGKHLERWL